MSRLPPALLVLAIALLAPTASAQVPTCSGSDTRGAADAFEEGNRLMQEAAAEARARDRERAAELAAEALTHFDRQCTLGDDSALAERGAALMLMGEPLRSAQSYDAYLAAHPLDALDARSRRRIEANLQPGALTLIANDPSGAATLFVDELDFGAVPRETDVRLPYGEHRIEVRRADGTIAIHDVITLSEASPSAVVEGSLGERRGPTRVSVPAVSRTAPVAPEAPGPRIDYLPLELAFGIGAGVFLLTGIFMQLGADGRAQAFNQVCVPLDDSTVGCEAVLAEYDGLFGGAIASYVIAGLAAVGLGVVLGLDLSQDGERESVSLTCAPGLGGVGCSGRF